MRSPKVTVDTVRCMAGAELTCESCGRAAEDLEAVHRIYVTPEAWDTEAAAEVMGDVERWCFSCRTHYPHQEVDRD